jgi:hypothetical protein
MGLRDSNLNTAEALDNSEVDIDTSADPTATYAVGDLIIIDNEIMEVVSTTTPASTPTIEQQFTDSPDHDEEITTGPYGSRGQTFSPSINHTIIQVDLLLFRHGTFDPHTLTVAIRAVETHLPTGAALASGTTDGSTLTSNAAGEWRSITLGAGAALTANTEYAITISGGSAAYIKNLQAGGYARTGWAIYGSADTWYSNQGGDILFKEYYNATTSGYVTVNRGARGTTPAVHDTGKDIYFWSQDPGGAINKAIAMGMLG